MKLFWLITSLACAVIVLSASADSGGEDRLIAILQSSASHAEKEDACRKLKQIGSAKAVPVLAELLRDDHLIQAACDALETMPSREVDAALLGTLQAATGESKVCLIHVLGERRNPDSVEPLVASLDDSDSLVSVYAARALGTIGGKEASRALLKALKSVKEPLRAAVVDALLHCATQLLAAGDHAAASSLFKRFTGKTEKEQVRVAAYAGLLSTAGERALPEIVSAVKGSDPAKQAAALHVARDVQGPKVTQAITNLLTQTSTAVQIALLGLLQQRDDTSAVPAVLTATGNADRDVRIAAITALGTLGDATAIPVLANAATSGDESEQKAARVALIELRRGKIAEAMIGRLAAVRPEVQTELVRALTARNEKYAVPKLIELARTESGPAQRAALRGLEQLAGPSDIPALVQLLVAASDEATRTEIRGVFESVADRAGDKGKHDVASIVEGLSKDGATTRVALLPVCSFFPDSRSRDALRSAMKDSDSVVSSAAARALCNTRDVELLPDLLELVRNSKELRTLAFERYLRLIGDEANGIVGLRRVELLRPVYDLANSREQKWSVLASLAGASHPEALEIANRARAEQPTRAEAELACITIAKSLLTSEPTAAMTMLRQLAAGGSDPLLRTVAQSVLKQFDSGWVYAGPYRQAGKECGELFDIAFPPEQRGTNQIQWRQAAGTPELARPGEVALADVTGGDHCVVYLKTRVLAPKAEPVTLEIGSDDGIKIWVNGEMVHANNAVRGLAPGQDRAKANLREGWNDLLAKITQCTAGCGMMLRIAGQDGTEIPGIKFDPNGGQ